MSKKIQVEHQGYSQSKEKTSLPQYFFMLVFFPVFVMYHFFAIRMFRRSKNPPHIVILSAIVVSFLIVGAGFVFKTFLPQTFIDVENIFGDGFVSLVFSVVSYLLIGVLWPLGFIFLPFILSLKIYQAERFIKQNVAYTLVPDSWCYNWNYKRTPLEKIRLSKNIKKIKSGEAFKKGYAVLGVSVEENDSRDKIVYRSHDDAKEHTFVVGGTGAGKTFGSLSRIQNSIENGIPTIFIDFKRSDETAFVLSSLAKANNAKFYHFLDCEPQNYNLPYSSGVTTYDPFVNAGNSTPEMLVNMREWSDDYYRQGATEFTQTFYKMLKYADPKFFLDNDGNEIIFTNRGEILRWYSALENLDVLYEAYKLTREENGEEFDKDMYISIKKMNSNSDKAAIKAGRESISGQIRNLLNSTYGKFLDVGNEEFESINIYDSTLPGSNDVILFSFSADSQVFFAEFFGSLVMQDLANISAKRRENNLSNPIHIYVDEFQAVPPKSISELAAKSRGSGLAMTFISQNLAQIEQHGGVALLTSLISTCSNFIIYNGSDNSSAELLAGILGRESKLNAKLNRPTIHRTIWEDFVEIIEDYGQDNVTTSSEDDWICAPKDFQGLKKPDKSLGLPPENISINKASGFENGKNYIKVLDYVNDSIPTLMAEFKEFSLKTPSLLGENVKESGLASKISKRREVMVKKNKLPLVSNGGDFVDDYYVEEETFGYNNGDSQHDTIVAENDFSLPDDDWSLENIEQLEAVRRKKKLARERKPVRQLSDKKMGKTTTFGGEKNFVNQKKSSQHDSSGGEKKTGGKNNSVGNVSRKRSNDISEKRKNMLDRFN